MSQIQIESPTWKAIMDDPALAGARRKLSFHEIRLIVKHAQEDATRPASSPIDMPLFCPICHLQHVDEPDERTPDWDNPPHRSHLCHGCGCIWRPADVPTNGVRSIETVGNADTWTLDTRPASSEPVAVDAWDADGSPRERAQAIFDGVEWAMNNCLPAKGESSEGCRRRRLIDAIATELSELRAALANLPHAAEGWQPIETVDRENGLRLILAWDDCPSLPYHWEVGRWSRELGWVNTYGNPFSGEPTHWMLPAPPSPGAPANG